MKSTNQLSIAALALLIVMGGGLLLVLLSYPAPPDVSVDGYRIDVAFAYTTRLITAYFLAVVALLAFSLWRFSARPGRRAEYIRGDRWHHLALTAILAGSVFVLVDMRLIQAASDDVTQVFWNWPDRKDAVLVEVLGQQFEWHFRYAGPDGKFDTPDDVETNGELRVPVGKPVLLQLRSRDVIHSLFLPNVRLKQDAIPGRTTRMWFDTKATGEFELACSQLCGLGHYRMRGQFLVVAQRAFDDWLAELSKEAVEEYSPTDKTANWGWDWEAR